LGKNICCVIKTLSEEKLNFKKMKQLVFGLLVVIIVVSNSCKTTGTMASIEPKFGKMELPAKGEFRMWRDLAHPSFSVILTNSSATQSCEVYKVTKDGVEKWVSPSLQAGKSLTVTVPANGYLFLKNFNDNILEIGYKVEE
jgi:hypothetical protein